MSEGMIACMMILVLGTLLSFAFLGCASQPNKNRGCYNAAAHSWCK